MKNYTIRVGEQVMVDGELREVVEIIKNTNGDPVILWKARHNAEGGCMPALWQEWRDGVPQDKRREV